MSRWLVAFREIHQHRASRAAVRRAAARRFRRGTMSRVLRLFLATSVLVLLAQIYLSRSLRAAFRASSPAAVPPSQSASVKPRVMLEDGMPRVMLEGGLLCHAAPWSLAHLRAQCRAGPLRYFYAYTALQSSWNAFQHIRRCVVAHCTRTARTRLRIIRACVRVHGKHIHAHAHAHAHAHTHAHAHPMRPHPCYTATCLPPGTW